MRSRRLPSHAGMRPTTAKVREALMAILGPALEGARVLDLFAGTGSLGLAALEEGAAEVLFVEGDARSLKVLHQEVGERGRIVRGRLPAALARPLLPEGEGHLRLRNVELLPFQLAGLLVGLVGMRVLGRGARGAATHAYLRWALLFFAGMNARWAGGCERPFRSRA